MCILLYYEFTIIILKIIHLKVSFYLNICIKFKHDKIRKITQPENKYFTKYALADLVLLSN